MKRLSILLTCVLTLCNSLLFSQSVSIYIDSRVPGYPQTSTVQSNYLLAGFSSVNITSGLIDNTVTSANYDVLIINEFYNYNALLGSYVPNFISAAQRQIAEDFIVSGGHVIWIAESWMVSPFSGGPIPQSTGMITTVNTLFGTSVAYGAFFDNGGMGSPNMPRTHPSAGPGALSVSPSILASGSYATLVNVPTENQVYSPESFDNITFFDPCENTTVALFPAYPVSANGSVIVCTEVSHPFVGYSSFGWPPMPTTYNTQFDFGIALLHYNLIVGNSMTAINNWSTVPGSVNPNCPPIALPSELVMFGVIRTTPVNVRVEWTTASEKDSYYFTVERSVDLINWEEQGKVFTTGNSDELKRYTFIDENALKAISYYRLKAVDIDGMFAYSDTRFIEPSLESVLIYPNPAADNLSISGIGDQEFSLLVFNELGQQLDVEYSFWEDAIQINLNRLPAGRYFVKVVTPELSRVLPFEVVR